jgi:hypothetical protein
VRVSEVGSAGNAIDAILAGTSGADAVIWTVAPIGLPPPERFTQFVVFDPAQIRPFPD